MRVSVARWMPQARAVEAMERMSDRSFPLGKPTGRPTRREIEGRRGGEECAGLLNPMCRRGLLEQAQDDSLRGDPPPSTGSPQ